MKNLKHLSVAAVVAVASACSLLSDRSTLTPVDGKPGLERSVYPIYVYMPEMAGNKITYRAGTAVCLSPRLLVTASALFYQTIEGATSADLNGIVIGNGAGSMKVEGFHIEEPLAFIRLTVGSCRPLKSVVIPPGRGKIVVVVAVRYRFNGDARWLAQPRWKISNATVTSDFSDTGRLSVMVPHSPGQAGAPILDADGNLVGVIIFRHGATVSVATAASLYSSVPEAWR